ncbi:putative metal-dependent hydrolase [Neobacillus mesonae]|nr:putative metal-dependent hydrolase [Neobacillus mesonae]
MDHLRYPIGQFEPIRQLSDEARQDFIHQLPEVSIKLRRLTRHLNSDQFLTPYRPEGWNIQQVIHHMADNDMNAYIRFKRALTEAEPVASSYREDLWAELEDYKAFSAEESIHLLEILHKRFFVLLISLVPDDFRRKLRTDALGTITLDTALQRLLWHNRHHTAQIEAGLHSK